MNIKKMELVFLLTLLPVTHSVKHSLMYFVTTSSGLQTFPDFIAVAAVDGVEVGYCDSNNPRPETKQDWAKRLTDDYPQHLESYTLTCTVALSIGKVVIEGLKHHFKHTAGVHILQEMYGCEQDDDKNFKGYNQFGYDGEDFTSLDHKTQTWVYAKPSVAKYKNTWERFFAALERVNFLTNTCPQLLMKYLEYGNITLQRKDPPSVSLLQKTPSSPVSCHATGFYPDRASMFWRKDGEELHEDVDHGEILPNHDGTFQISHELDLSTVRHENWSRYDCVFQLSGAKDIVIKLDEAVIRTNFVIPSPEPRNMTIAVILVAFFLVLVLVSATGFMCYETKASDNSSELCEKLNQET